MQVINFILLFDLKNGGSTTRQDDRRTPTGPARTPPHPNPRRRTQPRPEGQSTNPPNPGAKPPPTPRTARAEGRGETTDSNHQPLSRKRPGAKWQKAVEPKDGRKWDNIKHPRERCHPSKDCVFGQPISPKGHLDVKRAPKSAQGAPQNAQNISSHKKNYGWLYLATCWHHFGTILAPFWHHLALDLC